MKIPKGKKEQISIKVIETLYSRFENFPEDSNANRNSPFHEAFLNAFEEKFKSKVIDIPFFISLSSWLHGLNTTLGQSFFEEIAHILSDGQKKSFTKSEENVLKITKNQKNNIADIITDLKNGNELPNIKRENDLIFSDEGDEIEANNFTADVFIEDDDKITCVELKSVRPNSGEMRSEKQKILEAKSALYRAYKDKKIEFYIGFPFDPTSSEAVSCDKNRFLNYIIDGQKYYDHSEVLLADELWNFLSSSKNTMKQLLEIINSIAKPDFKAKYNKIFNQTTLHVKKREVLLGWNLFTEVYLIDKDSIIRQKIQDNTRLRRIYNQSIFVKGKYNIKRADMLTRLI